MGDETWQKFSADNPPPPTIAEFKPQIVDFCEKHASKGTCIVLVTSGGTTVPLEHNTVRFVDNFSAGTRGSASAEYFLKSGYAVIFLHRIKSLEPFSRHLPAGSLMKSLNPIQCHDGSWKIEVQSDFVPSLLPIVKSYQAVCQSNALLEIPFTTVLEYLHLLYLVASALRPMKGKAMLYLAAAVSDFYIPPTDMATHKISSNEPLNLQLQLVPKVLQPLVRHWVPEAFVVSFKLETNDDILLEKAKQALEKYGHKLVIANALHNRKQKVVLVSKDFEKTIVMSEKEMAKGQEIEEKIVYELMVLHNSFKSETA